MDRYAHMSSAFNVNGCFILRKMKQPLTLKALDMCLQRNDVSKALCKRVMDRQMGGRMDGMDPLRGLVKNN